MIDIDAFMADAVTRDTLPELSANEHYGTCGGLEWGVAPWRLRSGHVLDLKGSTLELDVTRVTDAMLLSQNPIVLIPSINGMLADKTGEAAWAGVLTHQRVKNGKLVANFSKLVQRAKALGIPTLRISGVQLQGHDAVIDRIILSDFGAHGIEAFPLVITGTDSGYDHHALYSVDPAHVYDEAGTVSTISNYQFIDYVPAASSGQVTIAMIIGSTCSRTIIESPWSEPGPYRQIMRRECALLDNTATVTGTNSVQGLTAYHSLKATVSRNKTQGASVGYYSDYLRSKGVHITADNSFMGGLWGAVVRLSPTAAGQPTLPEQFSAEDFVIEKFACDAGAGDVFLNADLLPMVAQNPPTRYLRNIAVDERLRILGNKEGLVFIPAPNTSRGGCRHLLPWNIS